MSDHYQLYLVYTQLTQGRTISDALEAFKNLKNVGAESGDAYFEAFGVGNTIPFVDRPYERLACYEFLLHETKGSDPVKFAETHKGTPYYFLAWTAFDIGNYSKASFYLDAALSEDIKKSASAGRSTEQTVDLAFGNPGGFLWKLRPDLSGPAVRITRDMRNSIERIILAFNIRTTTNISVEDFVDKFVVAIIKEDPEYRSLISAIYCFVFEYEDHRNTLSIRSYSGGSIEPLLTHLFKGGLIFESLLKYVGRKHSLITDLDPSPHKRNKIVSEIGTFNYSSGFIKRYCNFAISETSIKDLLNVPLLGMRNAFGVTHKLRNVTGHDLKQQDELGNPADYSKLFEQESDAILHIVTKEFLCGTQEQI